MIVVSDAGPLVYLGSVGRLVLLQDLFGRVVVPQQVWDEVVGAGAGRPGSAAVAVASWIDVRTPASSSLTERLHRILDAGEAAAIGLCHELHADLLLCDDLEARRVAAAEGYPRRRHARSTRSRQTSRPPGGRRAHPERDAGPRAESLARPH